MFLESRQPEPVASGSGIPTGTVAFLFTDIAGSTTRWERFGNAMRDAVTEHDAMLSRLFRAHGAHIFKTIGDAFCVAFRTVPDAVNAAIAAQRELGSRDWSAVEGITVRMAIHVGTTDERDGDYFGPVVNRVARLLSIAHGQQVILSAAARSLAENALPRDAALRDLGSHRLKDLSQPEAVAQLDVRGLPTMFPPLNSLDTGKTNLPLQVSPLVGRGREVSEIAELARAKPLITLCGTGGIGKTRIACQAGADVLADFPDGVWFIDFAPITEPALVPGVIATTFAVPDIGLRNVAERVVAFLQNRRLLLILDNCEQVVDAVATLVNAILRGCGGVHVVATSREALHVPGEELYRVPSLAVPAVSAGLSAEKALRFGSIELFVARSSAVGPFTLTDDNAPIVADICRRLDGIALAIELAASRVKVLSPRQLGQRLDERFRILTGGSRTALPRQQTLRALIDWSHDLLDERERAVFRRVGMFAAAFDLDAAIAVCADDSLDEWDVVDILNALVDKSLISVEPAGEERRYRLLESMRAYARERFRESDDDEAAIRQRWSGYYRTLVSDNVRELATQDNADGIRGIEIENDNFRSVLEWSIATAKDPVIGLEFAANLGEYWVHNGLQPEGVLWLEAGLRLVAEDTAKATVAQAWLAVAGLGQNLMLGKSGLNAAERAVALGRECDLPAVVARGLFYAGIALGRQGRSEEADVAFADARERLRELGDRRGLRKCLISQATIATMRGREDAARQIYEELLLIPRGGKPTHDMAVVTANFALLEFSCGNGARAQELGREAVAFARGLNDRALLASVLVNLAAFLIDAGEFDEARRTSREAFELAREGRYAIALCIAMEHLCVIAAIRGELAVPARLIGFTEESMQKAGFAREITEQRGYNRLVAILNERLGEAEIERLRESGHALAEEAAVELARTL
jgi:predicted ATPase/class 3 adenylate cyclase